MALLTFLCGRCGSERHVSPPAPAPSELVACPVCHWRASHADWAASTERQVRSLIGFRFGGERRRRL
jgi:hypothetical protein